MRRWKTAVTLVVVVALGVVLAFAAAVDQSESVVAGPSVVPAVAVD